MIFSYPPYFQGRNKDLLDWIGNKLFVGAFRPDEIIFISEFQ